MSERDVQNAIRLWCGRRDILCFRCNVGRVLTADGRTFDTGLPEGFPDLIILYDRTIWFCEVKTRKGRQREAQVRFQREVESRGYAYFVARSAADVAKALGLPE